MENDSPQKSTISNSHRTAILIMILCTAFTSAGQLLWKTGLKQADLSLSLLTLINLPFLLGFVSYAIGAILMLIAFKKGELSVLYPIIATSYVWVTIISPWLFNEQISPLKWIGIITIVISVSILGLKGSKSNSPFNKKKPIEKNQSNQPLSTPTCEVHHE